MFSFWVIFSYWLNFSYWLLHEAAPKVTKYLPKRWGQMPDPSAPPPCWNELINNKIFLFCGFKFPVWTLNFSNLSHCLGNSHKFHTIPLIASDLLKMRCFTSFRLVDFIIHIYVFSFYIMGKNIKSLFLNSQNNYKWFFFSVQGGAHIRRNKEVYDLVPTRQ